MNFYLGRNRAFAQLGQATLNGSDTNVALVTGHGSRLTQVTTASGLKVRAHIIERDPVTNAVIKCEIINITNNVSDSLTIERAVEATRATDTTNTYAATPQTFTSAAYIEEVISAAVIKQITDQINSVESAGAATYATKAEVAAGALVYGASSNGTDTYWITIANIAAYTNGFAFSFMADIGNVGAAYVRVTGSAWLLALLEIKKNHDQTLATGDIEAGQIVEVRVNTAQMSAQMVSQVATVVDLSGFASRTKQYTISGGVIARDVVYPSAADTVTKIIPSAMKTAVAITTAPGRANAIRNMPLSSGWYLHITGGSYSVAAGLYAQVRTTNALETDFSNESETSIYTTGNGVRNYEIAPLGGDKFILVYQCDTSGAAAGIRAVVISVSGAVVTVGTPQTIEAVGQLQCMPSIAFVDTNKAVIFYPRDSDGDLYAQVLSISGTNITTNTQALIKVCSSTILTTSEFLATNSVGLIYQDGSGNIFGRIVTVSGTTPSFGAENTMYTSPGANCVSLSCRRVTATKMVFAHANNTGLNDICHNVAISGATMTPSTGLALWSSRQTGHYGMQIIADRYMLFYHWTASTTGTIRFLDLNGTVPVSLSTQTVYYSNITQIYGFSVVKISPWFYVVAAPQVDGDYIVRLTPISTNRIGVAEGTIADLALGNIAKRFQSATLSGLVANSKYYLDDNWQITTSGWLQAPEVGFADSTTNLILT